VLVPVVCSVVVPVVPVVAVPLVDPVVLEPVGGSVERDAPVRAEPALLARHALSS
jgi:hypothetical protein